MTGENIGWKFSIADYFVSQALSQSTIVFILTLSAIYGLYLSGSESLATLPLGTQVLGVFVGLVPAAYLMKRAGRKVGFQAGALVGLSGALITAAAVKTHNFAMFTAGHFLIGLQQGTYQYLRFAAAETMPEDRRSIGISLVLAGGVVAAFLGPGLAGWVRNLSPGTTNPVAYRVLVVLQLSLFAVITFQNNRGILETENGGFGRSVIDILRVPRFQVSISASAAGMALMILLMTATPLSMKSHGFDGLQSALVIQWHVLGMFLPSFFSGWLIRRFGALKIIAIGWAVMSAEIAIAVIYPGFFGYWISLFLLGIAWNFLFVGGSSWLTGVYRAEEREKTQAAHDLIVYFLSTIASYSSAPLLAAVGWQKMQLMFLPPVLAGGIIYSVLAARERRTRTITADN